jgi:hypothetical protein
MPCDDRRLSSVQPDRVAVWRAPEGFGIDLTFGSPAGFTEAELAHRVLQRRPHLRAAFRHDPDGGWTVRVGPAPPDDARRLLDAVLFGVGGFRDGHDV